MFELDKLPFELDSFDKLSAKSLEIHYSKHHATYVKNLNSLLQEKKIEGSLEEIMLQSFKQRNYEPIFQAIFNNAAQHWNHTFFWNSLSPEEVSPSEKLHDLILKSFRNIDNLKLKFHEIGMKQFGSGWIWIVYNLNEKMLEILSTSNAENPFVLERIPLLVCDVWEHAYYVDFLNNRSEFLNVIFGYLNWSFASQNLEKI